MEIDFAKMKSRAVNTDKLLVGMEFK